MIKDRKSHERVCFILDVDSLYLSKDMVNSFPPYFLVIFCPPKSPMEKSKFAFCISIISRYLIFSK